MSLPLIGVDHKLVEVSVFLDDAQGNHICDVVIRVPQLVQFQVDSEHVFPDGVGTRLQTATHYVPADGDEWEEMYRCKNVPYKFFSLSLFTLFILNQRQRDCPISSN